MSAITGIFYRDGRKVGPELIKKMNDRLSHRGPDGSAVWCEGSVALGHQMLWTTPESLHEKLPFEDNESGLVITADARIDNRDELSKELDIEDKEEVSDSYFILKAYQMWGEDCPDKLLGDFAFAIWDKNEEKLFCARDHMGVKPFYYYLSDEMFVFGTEIKALFCVPGVPRELNERRLALFLMKIHEGNKQTFHNEIIKLSAANSLTLKQDNYVIKTYWKLDPKCSIVMDTDDDYFSTFREIFAEAVKCRLRSAFNMGFELSGGLDSSSIVCMAKKILNSNNDSYRYVNTFSHIFPDVPVSDEKYYIQKVVDTGGINPHFVRGDIISPFNQINTILWHHDQPFSVANIAMIWHLYNKMNENNIRVMLSGEGGDSTISHGNYYYNKLVINFQWIKLIKEIKAQAYHLNQSKYKLFANKVIFPMIPEQVKNLLRPHMGLRKEPEFALLNKDFLRKLSIQFCNDVHDEYLQVPIAPKKYHYHLISTISHQSILETVDPSIAAFSIESRYPFLDKRLIEFCYAVPTEVKFRHGWSRYLLRKSMENILPKEITWNPLKSKRGPVIEKNLFSFEKDLLEEIMVNNAQIKNYVNLNEFKKIYNDYKLKRKAKNAFDLWLLTLLSIWLQKIDV